MWYAREAGRRDASETRIARPATRLRWWCPRLFVEGMSGIRPRVETKSRFKGHRRTWPMPALIPSSARDVSWRTLTHPSTRVNLPSYYTVLPPNTYIVTAWHVHALIASKYSVINIIITTFCHSISTLAPIKPPSHGFRFCLTILDFSQILA